MMDMIARLGDQELDSSTNLQDFKWVLSSLGLNFIISDVLEYSDNDSRII